MNITKAQAQLLQDVKDNRVRQGRFSQVFMVAHRTDGLLPVAVDRINRLESAGLVDSRVRPGTGPVFVLLTPAGAQALDTFLGR